MIKINLLPPVKKEPFWQARHFYIIGIILFILSLGSSWGYLYHTEWTIIQQLQQIRQQHELLKPTMAQMQAAGVKQQAINARQSILIKLTQERPPLYAAITRLGAIIPEGVWLTDVVSDKNSLKVSGMAKSYPEVAAFLKKVQEDALYTEFSLIRTEQDKTTAKFEFTVKFKGM